MLRVVYLVFNEGYAASSGEALDCAPTSPQRRSGSARLLVELLTRARGLGLLALMLLQDSRRAARTSQAATSCCSSEQDRSLWNREAIEEGLALGRRALASRRFGPYTLQAAIAGGACGSGDAGATDWNRIVGTYNLLLQAEPSPVIELNRAAAIAMRDGPAAGLTLVDGILAARRARATTSRRMRRAPIFAAGSVARREARESYRRALDLTRQGAARRFIERRLAELPFD